MESIYYTFGSSFNKQVHIDKNGIRYKDTTIPHRTGDYCDTDFNEYEVIMFKIFIRQRRAMLVLQHSTNKNIIWYWYITNNYGYPTHRRFVMTKQIPDGIDGITEPIANSNKRYTIFFCKDGKLYSMKFCDPSCPPIFDDQKEEFVDFWYEIKECPDTSIPVHVLSSVDMGTYATIFYSDGTNQLRCRMYLPLTLSLDTEIDGTDDSIKSSVIQILTKKYSNKRFLLIVCYEDGFSASYMAGKSSPPLLILEDYKFREVKGKNYKWISNDEFYIQYVIENHVVVDRISVNAHNSKLSIHPTF